MGLEDQLMKDWGGIIKTRGIRVIQNEDGTYRKYNDEFKNQNYSYTREHYRVSYLIAVEDLTSVGLDESLVNDILRRDGAYIGDRLRSRLLVCHKTGIYAIDESGLSGLHMQFRSEDKYAEAESSLRSLLRQRDMEQVWARIDTKNFQDTPKK